jgi:eukaryotic-like serine/threonine-protein kinase
MSLTAGARLGPYEVVALLGSGGMGEVYKARDTRLDRTVAIKVLPADFAADAERLARFEREAKATAALSHPNILAIHDTGTHDGMPYLVEELLEGESLKDRLGGGPIPVRKAVGLAVQIAHGLAAAHEKHIVHRDLKPANVFLTTDGTVKILDFGLAKLVEAVPPEGSETVSFGPGGATDLGRALGTAGYMAPEQARGSPVDSRTDLFAFGVVLYEMLAGERPFRGRTTTATVAAILTDDAPPLPGHVPPALQRIVSQCLEKRPEDRFCSAHDLALALEAISSSGEPVPGAALAPMTPSPRPRRTRAADSSKDAARPPLKRPVLLGALVLVGIIGIAGVAAFVLKPAHKGLPIESLAVLPLENLSGDSSQEYFADGVTEAIITDLGQIAGIRVVSRTSVMHYKRSHRTLPEIARELNVDALVEGGLVRSGGRVRITAQLVALNPERHIWAANYERDAGDIIGLQRDVAEAVAREIRTTLSVAPRATTSRRPVNPQAYELYLRGREHLNSFSGTETHQAVDFFNQTIALEPGYAPAYASLAMAYAQMGFLSVIPRDEASRKAKEATARALALDDGLAEAHTANAYAAFLFDWDWRGPDAEFRRSLALNPNSAAARLLYSVYLTLCGRFDDAIRENRTAIELDPLNSTVNFNLGWTYYMAGRYAEGIAFMHGLQRRDPDYPFAHHHLAILYAGQGKCAEALGEAEHERDFDEAFVYARCGQTERALQLLRGAEREVAQARLDPIYPAWINAVLGRRDDAFRWLDRAIEERSTQVVFIRAMPELDGLRSDPRFAAALRRVGAK